MAAGPALRPVEPGDLDAFFEHQLDAEANRLAAFTVKDRTDRAAFEARWAKHLADPTIVNRTIVDAEGRVAGHVASFLIGEEREVTYWLGRTFWGRGLATFALQELLRLVTERPIRARVAKDNLGSLRVLQKCGFAIVGEDRGYANARGAEVEEFILVLRA